MSLQTLSRAVVAPNVVTPNADATSRTEGSLDSATEPGFRAIALAGTLGSGKTTTLNSILRTARQAEGTGSFVVIENDLGTANTDKLRVDVPPDQLLALTSGCVCCNDLQSLKAAIKSLKTTRAQSGITTAFVETTGVADPIKVKAALLESEVPTLLIVTVDVCHFEMNRILKRDQAQFSAADILMFTWWDHPGGRDALGKVIEAVRTENPNALLVKIDREGCFSTISDAPLSFLNLELSPRQEQANRLDRAVPAPMRLARPETADVDSAAGIFGELLVSVKRPVKHSEYSLSTPLRSGISLGEIQAAVHNAAPIGLLRAKGTCEGLQFDCVHGDWSTSKNKSPRVTDFLTVISSRPLEIEALGTIALPRSQQTSACNFRDPAVLAAAVALVEKFIPEIPTEVVKNGNLITRCEASEAWKYTVDAAFPSDVGERFQRALCTFMMRQYEALQTGEFSSHPALPYYQKEIGGALSWLMQDCREAVERWGFWDRIVGARPCTLYFTGLAAMKSPLHVPSLAESGTATLEKRIRGLLLEHGERRAEAENLLRRAFSNAESLCLDSSWRAARKVLAEGLKSSES